jgi:uncharacterized protein YbcC (UPF0753/DUF2309 family)
MAKWLAAFMDEGLAEWKCQIKKMVLWCLAKVSNIHDLPKTALSEIQKTSNEALNAIMDGYAIADYTKKIFTSHLAALPGWTDIITVQHLILHGNKNILLP